MRAAAPDGVSAYAATAFLGSPTTTRYSAPPTRPPTIGMTMNSQSRDRAHPPWKTAGPMLRAGFTEVFVTGAILSPSWWYAGATCYVLRHGYSS